MRVGAPLATRLDDKEIMLNSALCACVNQDFGSRQKDEESHHMCCLYILFLTMVKAFWRGAWCRQVPLGVWIEKFVIPGLSSLFSLSLLFLNVQF